MSDKPKLTDAHMTALAGALSLAARMGGAYEVYGGVNVTDTISYGNEAYELIKDGAMYGNGSEPDIEPGKPEVGSHGGPVFPGGGPAMIIMPDVEVPPEEVDTGNMPAAERDEDKRLYLTPRRMCGECDAFLGYSHREGCSRKPGVVQVSECEEKWTSVEHSDEQPPKRAVRGTPFPATSGDLFDFRWQEQMGGEPPFETDDSLATLLYLLMRDELSAGVMEKYVCELEREAEQGHALTNRFLAGYATNLADRIVRVAGKRLGALQRELAEMRGDDSATTVEGS